MEAAITFADTGHLCLATLHSTNANQAFERIINFFSESRHAQLFLQLSLNLRAIVSQRLVLGLDGKRVAALEVLLDTPRIKELIKRGEVDTIKEAMVQGAQASAERIVGLLDTDAQIKDSPEVLARIESQQKNPAPRTAIDGFPDHIDTLEFRNVTFSYNPNQEILRNFNLTVKTGQSVALVGPTGGGKTTIVGLLCRFYEPTSGSILINGIDYRQRSLRWLQSKLGIVLQQPHLFSGTIRDNIRYGKLAATDAEIEEAAKRVNAHEFITALTDGYNSQVGEGGGRLSTGQKQLIALARAILANPQIFIMDEATSSVDTQTERSIQSAVERMLEARISFVIAHRLSTIRSADRILVIEGGQIVEAGPHRDLIRRRGSYYDLYTHQFAQEREEQVLDLAANAAS